MATKQNCASCKWASISATECTYPPLNLPEATWTFITAHHAHPVKTTPHGGAECAMYDRKPGRPDPDPNARMCGNCEFFDADRSACTWDGPAPSAWTTDEGSVFFHDGTDCPTFKKREPEIVPATIDDVTGGPWNPAPPQTSDSPQTIRYYLDGKRVDSLPGFPPPPFNPMTDTTGATWRSDDLSKPIQGWRGTIEIRDGDPKPMTAPPEGQATELARLRAENERLKATLDKVVARTLSGQSYRMAQEIHDIAVGISAAMARGKS